MERDECPLRRTRSAWYPRRAEKPKEIDKWGERSGCRQPSAAWTFGELALVSGSSLGAENM